MNIVAAWFLEAREVHSHLQLDRTRLLEGEKDFVIKRRSRPLPRRAARPSLGFRLHFVTESLKNTTFSGEKRRAGVAPPSRASSRRRAKVVSRRGSPRLSFHWAASDVGSDHVRRLAGLERSKEVP